jgi:hypothetical protein
MIPSALPSRRSMLPVAASPASSVPQAPQAPKAPSMTFPITPLKRASSESSVVIQHGTRCVPGASTTTPSTATQVRAREYVYWHPAPPFIYHQTALLSSAILRHGQFHHGAAGIRGQLEGRTRMRPKLHLPVIDSTGVTAYFVIWKTVVWHIGLFEISWI